MTAAPAPAATERSSGGGWNKVAGQTAVVASTCPLVERLQPETLLLCCHTVSGRVTTRGRFSNTLRASLTLAYSTHWSCRLVPRNAFSDSIALPARPFISFPCFFRETH